VRKPVELRERWEKEGTGTVKRVTGRGNEALDLRNCKLSRGESEEIAIGKGGTGGENCTAGRGTTKEMSISSRMLRGEKSK